MGTELTYGQQEFIRWEDRYPVIAAPYGSLVNYRLKSGAMGSGDLELVWFYDGPILKVRRPDGHLVSVLLDCGDEAELICAAVLS